MSARELTSHPFDRVTANEPRLAPKRSERRRANGPHLAPKHSERRSANAPGLAPKRFDRQLAIAVVITAIFAGPACSTDSSRWGRGDYVELKTYTSVDFRRGPTKIDPRTGELTIEWVGAHAPEGDPRILDCQFSVFDDKNGNGTPDPGEILQQRSSREVCRKVIFGGIHVRPGDATGALLAQIEVHTERRYRSVVWKLVPD